MKRQERNVNMVLEGDTYKIVDTLGLCKLMKDKKIVLDPERPVRVDRGIYAHFYISLDTATSA